MFPAVVTSVSYVDDYVSIYTETHVDIFDVNTGDWVQTINLKKVN